MFTSAQLDDARPRRLPIMSEKPCKSCRDKDARIVEQQKKIELLQQKFRGVVNAFKDGQEKLAERDKQLLEASIAATAGPDGKRQERLSSLEASVSELSKLCGEYESERERDHQLISDLRSQIDQYASKQKALVAPKVSFDEHINRIVVSRSSGIQTDAIEPVFEVLPEVSDVSVQTDIEPTASPSPSVLTRKPDLAVHVVIPTHREVDPIITGDESASAETENFDVDPIFIPETPSTPPEYSPIERRPKTRTISESTTTASVAGPSGPSGSGVSLFYVNELARKEIELAEARLQAREFECALRELQWKHNVDKYR